METGYAPKKKGEALNGAFFWLMAFYFIYCARPQDYISVLAYIPMAKITSVFAILGLLASAGKTPRNLKDLPKEASYLFFIIVILFVSAILSPVSRADAFFNNLDFAKVFIVWILTFLLVTTLGRLRQVIFIQTASVAIIAVVAVVKGHSIPRLAGVIGGFYSNPNDMAFAIVLSLPFCLAFLLSTTSGVRKAAWGFAIFIMVVALFLTASRAGFIDLVISGTVCLWHFGVKGKRRSLIISTVLLAALLIPLAGGTLVKRFAAISGDDLNSQIEGTAYGSYEERKLLMERAVSAIIYHPLLGVGPGDFIAYSGLWKNVHASYLQIAADGGIPVLVLYLMFFYRGFANLKRLRQVEDSEPEMILFEGASLGSLVGFVVGACFAPEAYQYFPYFAVCYTSVLVAIMNEKERSAPAFKKQSLSRWGFVPVYTTERSSHVFGSAR